MSLLLLLKPAFPPQKAYVIADSVDGAWTDQNGGTNLFEAINETSFSDADYIKSEEDPVNSSCRLKLGNLYDPIINSGHIIRWRPGKNLTGGNTINIQANLYQGGGDVLGAGTVIASFQRNNVDAFTTYEEVILTAEAATITNYADLYMEFFAYIA